MVHGRNVKNTLLVVLFTGCVMAVLINVLGTVLQEPNQVNVADVSPDSLPTVDDTAKHLFWFVQVSDLHFSKFHDPARVMDFEKFCHINIDVIKPKVILVTGKGDITDAKYPNLINSKQFIEEWNSYRDVIHRTGIASKILWLDIRGNHDNFNVLNVNSTENYFRTHSIQGKHHTGSYVVTVENDSSDKYNFVAVDACVKTGLKRPFNFVGVVNKEDYLWLEKKVNDPSVNGTLWFGHYTTSTILSPYPGIRHLMRNGLAYLCGHLHTLYNTAPKLTALHGNGLLELEVGDWKDYRIYRILAIDHGLLSFVDVKFGEWPVILVTNPKQASHLSPNSEPISRIAKSSHIRILVFSPFNVTKVSVSIDDGEWNDAKMVVNSPLFVFPWQPNRYSSGLHRINVIAWDEAGNEKRQETVFSIDGSRPSSPRMARFIIKSHIGMLQVAFACQILAILTFLSWLRYIHSSPYFGKTFGSSSFPSYLIMTMSVDRLFYPLIFMIIYPAIGPWFVGYMSEDSLGVVFIWGILMNNEFVPGSLAYMYGSFQSSLFTLPLVLAIAQCVKYRILQDKAEDTSCTLLGYIKRHLLFVAAILYQSWYIIFALILWTMANRLPKTLIQRAQWRS